jgi:nucleoside-diphosphate-sugar epimerase
MEAAQEKKSELKNKQPTALIVGGAGFVGSHLCETLVAQNFQVICVDNLSTGKKENLKGILTAPNFTFIEADINEPNFRQPEGVKIDYCFHLASIEQYKSDKNISLDTLLVNSLGTRQLLEIARDNKAKFILFSSADLYSGAISSSSLRFYFGKSPEGEELLSVHEAKRFAEALAFEYFKKFNLETTIIRLKDVYGPKMNLERGDEIASLIKSAISKENLNIYGDGLKTINPTFISDIVFGSVKASIGDFSGQIFILVNGDKVTVESFAQTLKLVCGPLEIEHKKASDQFDLPSYHLDLENTKEKLSWSPKVSLAEGLASVVQSQHLKQAKEEPAQGEKLDEIRVKPSTEPERTVEKEKKVSKHSRKSIWLRVAIFVSSLLLLTFTVIYPMSSVVFSGYFATRDLEEATADLNFERTEVAISNSLKAQNGFNAASQSLQNVNWLLKTVGLGGYSANLDKAFEASTSLSEAVRNGAKANQLLIDTAEKIDELSPSEAQDKLEEALNSLYKGQEMLEQSQLLQEVIKWEQIPSSILPEKGFFDSETASLSRELEQLVESIEENLSQNQLE